MNTTPLLEEKIVPSLNYGDLPEENWRVPEVERFSQQKTPYDYQRSALENAAWALCLYYKKGKNAYQPGEAPNTNEQRKVDFADHYHFHIDGFSIHQYESKADRRNQRQNPVFRILSEFIASQGEEIPYRHIINRMCFWMATGSGKTLVMIKLIEYLHCLQQHRKIPSRKILVLAPSEHLLGQIRRSIEEFNQTGLSIDFVPLRELHRVRQGRLGTSDAITVYYHRSDNVSDAQKEALIDYRRYENDGKWYILLDEAHKGGKEDSKRQAYYAVMAREGFLFNFSATFTDKEDIVTTVKKYNLQEFVRGGRGKNIYLNEEEYTVFKDRSAEVNRSEREKIVLKSLLTFACVSRRVFDLREKTNIRELYHLPLMLTLVNSVNTNVEKERNDLWAFFQILRRIASGEIDAELFEEAKSDLIEDWQRRNSGFVFEGRGAEHLGKNESFMRQMTVADVRKAVFLSCKKGALQLIRSRDNKELAFQMKNADSPFALIRIGDTSKWRKELLAGYEETAAMQETSYFDGLEQSPITLLMGSRSFFESWDSNRPNVINYINIGGSDAKKFVVQSIGRGVRIETLPGKRRRYSFLPNSDEKARIVGLHDGEVVLPETLFLFATNRNAVKSVLEGLETERSAMFEKLDGIEKAPVPKIGGQDMPLLIPKYREAEKGLDQSKFAMSERTQQRFSRWLVGTSDAVFTVRDGFDRGRLAALQGMVQNEKDKIQSEKDYARLPFLQECLLDHLSKTEKVTDGVRALENQDVVHFREIRVLFKHVHEIQRKIDEAKQEPLFYQEIREMAWRLEEGEIGRDEFAQRVSGRDEVRFEVRFEDLIIKKIVGYYYFPIILGNEKVDYIRHIIKVRSEVEFLNSLENWLKSRKLSWDAWMFTKIDEFWDKIYIPYYDEEINDYHRFLPDFVFWMCKGDEYHIVFVDPKGTVHDSAYHKIDGYRNLFEENGNLKQFKYRGLNVRVGLWMFNKNSGNVPEQYRRFYIDSPDRIFEPR